MNNLKNYHTKQKSQIRDIFINNPNDNFTADKLMLLLTKNNTPVSKATLYRTLDFMFDNGEIIKYNIDKNQPPAIIMLQVADLCFIIANIKMSVPVFIILNCRFLLRQLLFR